MIMFVLQVRDFNVVKFDKDIGFYVGYIGELIIIFEMLEIMRMQEVRFLCWF